LAAVLREFLPKGTKILALIKPQFELGAAALNKAGIVTDPSLYNGLEQRALEQFPGGKFIPSRITGQDGNREFFLFARI
jgi:23S rRNA (cytidine1920-2'-O)/16S rRNA (cytidine1409-2'-O)-methyltransferase